MTYPQSADRPTPDNPQPTTNSDSRAIRFAISAGPLTAPRLAARQAEAKRRGVRLFEVCSEAELLHLQFIQRAMLLGSTWEDAVEAIRTHVPPA